MTEFFRSSTLDALRKSVSQRSSEVGTQIAIEYDVSNAVVIEESTTTAAPTMEVSVGNLGIEMIAGNSKFAEKLHD